MIFFHIGGGAGDLDPAANFRDGFSEFVKSHKSKNKNIFIIEANPSNINKLKKSWKKYRSVRIFNIAISSNNNKRLKFFYSEKDAPHYQLFSSDINHIKRHFPESKIKTKFIKAITINNFLDENNYEEVFHNHKNIVIDLVKKYNKELLMYNFKDGWKPFCDFLNVETPNKDIPWINKNKMFDKI